MSRVLQENEGNIEKFKREIHHLNGEIQEIAKFKKAAEENDVLKKEITKARKEVERIGSCEEDYKKTIEELTKKLESFQSEKTID